MNFSSQREEELFHRALALPDTERADFLCREAADNPDLRASIASLLSLHDDAQRSLNFVVPGVAEAMAQLAPSPLEKPGDSIGRYRLVQKIGEGGCGVVYMAEQQEPVVRRVALKVIKLGMDTKAVVARFEAERQALALMEHPNIAKVLDGGTTHTGRPFFVMELVRGISITRYCDDHQLTPVARLELFVKVCRAVQHAHQKGIIHRDLKPSNILVTVHDGVATPKIIDFGIAKATQGRLTNLTVFTAFEQFIGTPVYMSPEQAELTSVDVDTRSDIYSLGVLLYELLTGRPPFDPKKFAQAGVDHIRQQIREVEPPRPSARLNTLTDEEQTTIAKQRGTAPASLSVLLRGDLDWIVMRCLEKDRTRRYDTANGLAMDIRRYLHSEPVTARPPSRAYVLRKLVRRHRVVFATAGIVAVTLVLGVAISTRAFLREKAARVRAVAAEDDQKQQRENALSAQASEAQLRRTAERNELAARRRAYAADINLVQQALAIDNLARAQKLLDRQRPQLGQPDLRGWEWRYLWKLCQSDAQSTICENRGRIGSVAASCDGRWLAVGSLEKGSLAVFDLQSGEEIAVPAGDAEAWVAFSPTEPVIAVSATTGGRTARPSYRVFFWNVVTRQKILELSLRQFCGRLAFSHDGKALATASNELAVWRVSDGKKLSSARLPPGAWPANVHSPAGFNADCTLGACVVQGSKICVIDLRTGEIKWQAMATDPAERITAMAFSSDKRLLATGAGFQDTAIRLWDVASGREIARLEGHRGHVQTLAFWADGKTLASAGGDQTIRLWNVETGKLLRTLRGHKSGVRALALLPNSKSLASGSTDGSVRIWDPALTERSSSHIVLPKPTVTWRVNPDDGTLITIDNAGAVEEWSGRGFETKTVLMEVGPSVEAGFSKDGSALVTASSNWNVRTWDWTWQRASNEWPGRSMHPIALIAGGQKLIVASGPPYFSIVEEWMVDTRELVRSWEVPYILSDRGLAVSPDERWIVVGSLHNGFVIIDRESGLITVRSEIGSRGPAFSPDSRLLAVPYSHNGRIHIWDVAEGREITYIDGFLQAAHAAAFSPDGSRLAVSSGGREAMKIWDMASLENLITLEAKGSTSRTNTAFSSSGDILGAYFGNQILNLWRAPSWAEIEAAERVQQGVAQRGRQSTTAVGNAAVHTVSELPLR